LPFSSASRDFCEFPASRCSFLSARAPRRVYQPLLLPCRTAFAFSLFATAAYRNFRRSLQLFPSQSSRGSVSSSCSEVVVLKRCSVTPASISHTEVALELLVTVVSLILVPHTNQNIGKKSPFLTPIRPYDWCRWRSSSCE
jgi:hypothetical protein